MTDAEKLATIRKRFDKTPLSWDASIVWLMDTVESYVAVVEAARKAAEDWGSVEAHRGLLTARSFVKQDLGQS